METGVSNTVITEPGSSGILFIGGDDNTEFGVNVDECKTHLTWKG